VHTVREIAEKHSDTDLLAFALQDHGRALVLKDRVEEGMELLEEAMSLAMSGELSPQTVGSTYCNMISTCGHIADYRRAGEWSDSAVRWCEPHRESPFPGLCSIHRADVMRVRGAWDDATVEVERMIAFHDGRHEVLAAEGFYLKGEILLRRGDFDEAERCFREAHQRGRHPVPGLALLRVAQERAGDAASLIDRGLEQETIALRRIRLLPAAVEAALADGNVDRAREHADELSSLASRYESSVFHGQAEQALGAVAMAEGDIDAALASLRRALDHWKAADMPYDGARTRLQLARAYRDHGENDLAALEAGAARRTFFQLGAKTDGEQADALLENL
jgi:tetratricopeptide (TPR) repeat protein